VRYFNGDSARSLGIEFSVVKRTTRYLTGSASLELQRSTGTNSTADAAYLQAVFGEDYDDSANLASLTRSPLLWDKPWAFSINADYAVGDRDRPVFLGWRMPPNWSVNVLWQAEAGQRYTPKLYLGPKDYQDGSYYGEVGPSKGSFNVRFNKFWEFRRRERLTVSLEIRNLLNHLNYRRVNPWTGEGYKLGDYNPGWTEQDPPPGQQWADYVFSTDSEDYALAVVDPSYIEDPLTILWGVSYSW
jgi:hypothetical protein